VAHGDRQRDAICDWRVVAVTLGFGPGTTPEKYDLVVVLDGSQLLVDDIYCAGADPTDTDVYSAGWIDRSTCTS
jgi:hypothetical protein